MRTQKLDTLNVSKEVLSRLALIMTRVSSGSTEDIRSPMFKTVDDNVITREWQSIVDNSDKLTDMLVEIELSNLAKFGPRSIAKPWEERREATLSYFKSSDSLHELDIAAASYAQLRPVSIDVVIDKHVKNNTNSGLPDLTRKGLVKDKYRDSSALRNELDEEFPAVLFTRTQEGGKTRAVWGYDISTVIAEQQFYQPFLGLEKNMPVRAALQGPDETDKAVSRLIRTAKRNGKALVGVDFSAYDQSLTTELIAKSFSYVGSFYDANYSQDIKDIYERFISIPLATPDGIIHGYHGVPSGSTFTNAIDSIAQYSASGRDLSRYQSDTDVLIQGDDGLYVEGDPDSLMAQFEASGLNINRDKSLTSHSEVMFLQRYYHEAYQNEVGDYVGVYSTFRALNRIVHLEMWTDIQKLGIPGRDFFAIRTLSILENCKHHPLFEELVKFVAKYDENSLEFDSDSVIKYVEGLKHRAGGLINQYSDTVEGINNFESVKLLRRG